jgi:hypothetical protein
VPSTLLWTDMLRQYLINAESIRQEGLGRSRGAARSRIAENRSGLSCQSARMHRNIQALPLFESGALT